jgi:hypothetical protein
MSVESNALDMGGGDNEASPVNSIARKGRLVGIKE